MMRYAASTWPARTKLALLEESVESLGRTAAPQRRPHILYQPEVDLASGEIVCFEASSAIALDLGIVIIGVFIGTQVSNWNQERLESRETERLLQELRPELKSFTDFTETARPSYATPPT